MSQINKTTLDYLQIVLSEMHGLISDMDRAGGWLALEPRLAQWITRTRLPWYHLYDDREQLHKLLTHFLLLAERVPKKSSPDNNCRQEFLAMLPEMHDAMKDIDALTESDIRDMRTEMLEKVTPLGKDERVKNETNFAMLMAALIANLCNYVSLMVHGRSLCELVTAAKAGDDKAFVLAVQIDRTILNLPYFQQRLALAQLGKEPEFLSSLAYRLKNPLLSTRREHLKLWLAFAILDDERLLRDMTVDELMVACRAMGAYDGYDADSLRKRRHDYLRQHQTSKTI